jgi:hypothetical protein
MKFKCIVEEDSTSAVCNYVEVAVHGSTAPAIELCDKHAVWLILSLEGAQAFHAAFGAAIEVATMRASAAREGVG